MREARGVKEGCTPCVFAFFHPGSLALALLGSIAGRSKQYMCLYEETCKEESTVSRSLAVQMTTYKSMQERRGLS